MAEIVNLRNARKQKSRQIKDAQAAENRAKFGRTKAEKDLEKAQAILEARRIEAHKRDD